LLLFSISCIYRENPLLLNNAGLDALKIGIRKKLPHRELDAILRFGTLINSSLHIEDVLEHAMKWAQEFMDAEASSVYELDRPKNELFIRLARGDKKESVRGIRLKVGEGIAGWVARTGRAVVSQDVSKDKRFSPKYDEKTGFKTRSVICVPLISKDEPTGVLQVINKKDGKPFSNSDFKLLTGMAQQVAIAMENAKLYQRLKEDFALTTRELKMTQEKLIRSERLTAIGHLVEGVAHEIRNPIMTIGGFAERLKKELKPGDRLQDYADVIMEETNRLEKLVEQVGEFMDVQSASLGSELLPPVAQEVIKKFTPLAKALGVQIVTEIDGNIPPLEIDVPQLTIALSHVMENALESMPDGGTLSLEIHPSNKNVLITISDTGFGIPADQLEAVYDPFVTSKPRGAGLGLTMVHRIVMNHDGEIKISSQLDKGTIVVIRLPVPNHQNEESSHLGE
jgi:signal transduction histidine kinase